MIRYALKCQAGHAFESWFKSAEAFDGLRTAGHVACPECGSCTVDKALMAPQVASGLARAADEVSKAAAAEAERAAAIAALKTHVEANSDYVGMNFVAEARAMHLGDAPERSIYGEARPEEAMALLEEGVPVAPLPFLPTRKSN
ncbi:DUF1178 family protein [Rhodobacter sp. KR11]|jgi:hypothetical protein|uniref:DUF1178 family protein n=1 Tax=Rhodobacter sp. KR11 TaxID=2974588 RepID=UPI002223B953|nr:DUF1178 family protein [Rhodobacter sp. KR11]MCW1920067.1 DUF1178 family protein [Rhodobacter sp. KR11]